MTLSPKNSSPFLLNSRFGWSLCPVVTPQLWVSSPPSMAPQLHQHQLQGGAIPGVACRAGAGCGAGAKMGSLENRDICGSKVGTPSEFTAFYFFWHQFAYYLERYTVPNFPAELGMGYILQGLVSKDIHWDELAIGICPKIRLWDRILHYVSRLSNIYHHISMCQLSIGVLPHDVCMNFTNQIGQLVDLGTSYSGIGCNWFLRSETPELVGLLH